MAFANKLATNIGLTPHVKEFAKEKAKEKGMSLAVYIEQLIRSEMEKEAGN